jgi:hypothetical protein
MTKRKRRGGVAKGVRTAKSPGIGGGLLNPPTPLTTLMGTITLGQLSRKLGVSMSMLSKVFNGKRTPGMRLGRELAFALGTTVDRLMLVLDLVQEQRKKEQQEQAAQKERHDDVSNQPDSTDTGTTR